MISTTFLPFFFPCFGFLRAPRLELFDQPLVDLLHVDVGGDPVIPSHVLTLHRQSQILGHDTVLVDDFNTGSFQVLGERLERGGLVQLGSEGKPSGPGKDGGNRVGRGFVTSLVLSVVSGDGTVGSFRFHGLAVRGDELGSHHTERTETLGENVALYLYQT